MALKVILPKAAGYLNYKFDFKEPNASYQPPDTLEK